MSFPRTVCVYLRSSYDVLARRRLLAVAGYHQAVIDLEWLAAGELLGQLRRSNPWLDLFFYLNPVELSTSPGSGQTFEQQRLAWMQAEANDWFVVDTAGDVVTTNIGGTATNLCDVTNPDYRAALVAWLVDALEGTGHGLKPRLLLDRVEANVYAYGAPGNVYGNARIALARDGVATASNDLATAWQAGFVALLDALEAAGVEVLANFGWNSWAGYLPHCRGIMLEDFCMPAAPADEFTWAGQMRSLCGAGRYSFGCLRRLADPADADWLKYSRLAVCSSLLAQPASDPTRSQGGCSTNAPQPSYYVIQESDYCGVGATGVSSSAWSDRGYLGRPLGPAYVAGGTQTLCDLLAGVDWLDANDTWHVREHAHGWTLANPSNDDHELPNRWAGRQVQGMQDPQTLDGSLSDTILLPARDGRILLRG